MITRIELHNFMSHAKTVIEPAAGLTVLIGPNNCGKSAIVTALQILAHNDNSTYVCRHGAKRTEVIVQTDDNHTIKWSRTKSGSPKYEIDGQLFDRLKKSGTPELIAQTLRLGKVSSDKDSFDIHFGQQKDPVFLLGDSGKAAAQFFASSSDAIRLVEMQGLHKSKVSTSKRDLQRLKIDQENLQNKVTVLSTAVDAGQQLTNCEELYRQLIDSIQSAKMLVAAIDRTGKQQYRLELQVSLAKAYSGLSAVPDLSDEKPLAQLVESIRQKVQIQTFLHQIYQSQRDLQSPPLLQQTKELELLIDCFQTETQSERQAARAHQQLAQIAAPPELENESELQLLLNQFAAAKRRSTSRQQKTNLFKEVTTAPGLLETDSLAKLTTDLKKSELNLSHLEDKQEQIATQLQVTQNKIQLWVENNPTCPTCGSVTTAEKLLSSSGCHE